MLPAHYRNKESSYFCRFTFSQFFTLLVIEVFTLFFIFYLGARYGRELLGFQAPTTEVVKSGFPKIESTDPNVVAAVNDPEIKALAREMIESAPSPDLKKRVANLLQESAEREEGKTPQERVASVKSIPSPVPAAKAEKFEPESQKPKGPLYKSPKSKPVIQTNPFRARYSVQVGSYTNVDEAHSMVNYWKQKGYNAFMISADIPGKGRWYRVRMGGFNLKTDAEAYLSKVIQRENIEAFVAANE